MSRGRLTLLALFLLGACHSTPTTLQELYGETLADLSGTEGLTLDAQDRNIERYSEVRTRLADDEVQTAQDYFFAAAILSTSDEMEDLEISRQLAAHANELGDPRGLVIVAEATDKILLQMGGRQRYGTQIYLNMATHRWQLYPFDTGTTDAERASMGLPTLLELLAKASELNEQVDLTDALIEAVQPE